MNTADINAITVGQILTFVTAVGVFSGFFGKFFSQIYKIKQLTDKQDKLEKRMNSFEEQQIQQK